MNLPISQVNQIKRVDKITASLYIRNSIHAVDLTINPEKCFAIKKETNRKLSYLRARVMECTTCRYYVFNERNNFYFHLNNPFILQPIN